jgi:hypothetical protein
MELRDFIKEALKDIMGGVADAQNEISSGSIVPRTSDSFQSVETGISNIQPIQFEVTVSTGEKSGSEAKLSVVAAVIGGNVKGDSSNSSGHVARLAFKVPVKFSPSA